MPSPIARTTLPASEPPRWVRAVDALCLALVVLSALVAMSGGFRVRIGPFRVAVTSPYVTLLWAFAIAIVRHVLAPAAPIYRDLPARLGVWWREPRVHTAAMATAGTRPAILFVGYMAVLVFGYPPGPAPPVQINNELVNLQARWDANWYLGIVTEGYHFVPNQPGLQQSVAFFPAYPMLVRGVGRILGGRLTSYIGAGAAGLVRDVFPGAHLSLRARARHARRRRSAFCGLGDRDVSLRAVLRRDLYRAAPAARDGRRRSTTSRTDGCARRRRGVCWLASPRRTASCCRYHSQCWPCHRWLGRRVGRAALAGWAACAEWAGKAGRARRSGTRTGRTDSVTAHRVVAALLAAGPGVGMLIYSAYVWQLTDDPLGWLRAHGAWPGYSGLLTLVGDRVNIIANAGVEGYVASLPHDLINALGVIFVLAAVWPVARKLGLAYAVFILIFILPPLAAGGLISAGRSSSVLFPAFLWLAERFRPDIAGMAGLVRRDSGFKRGMFYTWRPSVLDTRLARQVCLSRSHEGSRRTLCR